MEQSSLSFLERAHDHMTNPELRGHMDGLGLLLPAVREQTINQLGNFAELRDYVRDIRRQYPGKPGLLPGPLRGTGDTPRGPGPLGARAR